MSAAFGLAPSTPSYSAVRLHHIPRTNEEARELFRQAGDHAGIAWTTMSLGAAALLRGDHQAARAALVDSFETLVSNHVALDLLDVGLVMLAATDVASGEHARAVPLLASVDGFCRSTGTVLESQHGERYTKVLAEVRDHLSANDFADLWAEGESHTLFEAARARLA